MGGGVVGQRHAPTALHPGKARYPLCRRLGRPQGRSGRARKISLPPGFETRTVQPVASGYTRWVIPANATMEYRFKGIANYGPGKYGKQELRGRGLRGWPRIEWENICGSCRMEATRLAEDRKAFRIWLTQPDAWKRNKETENKKKNKKKKRRKKNYWFE